MAIHSDSVYKDTQREIEAEKVDTKKLLSTILPDGEKIYLGSDKDASVSYDPADDTLKITGASELTSIYEDTTGGNPRLVVDTGSQGGIDLSGGTNHWLNSRTGRLRLAVGGTRILGMSSSNFFISGSIYDDETLGFGTDTDFNLVYDSGTDRLEVVDAINGVNLLQFIKNEGVVHALALDSAPAHEVGKMVLASPTWDPDGDGNGELVMSDGAAWNEVCDLPNYT